MKKQRSLISARGQQEAFALMSDSGSPRRVNAPQVA
jgi:hypothetical protein